MDFINNNFLNKYRGAIIQIGVVVFIALISFVLNRFPTNSMVAVGDFYQLIDPKDHLDRYSYLWFNQAGQGRFNPLFVAYPYYALLSLVGAKTSLMAGFSMFLLLYFSYLSFFLSIKWLFPKINAEYHVLSGLVYALNNFTITILTYSWGYTHHFMIYVFIPLIIGLTAKIIFQKKVSAKAYLLFFVITALSLVSFNNIAFLIAILFLSLLVLLFALVFRQARFDRLLGRKIIIVGLIYLLATLVYLLVPIFISLRSELSQIAGAAAWGEGGLRNRLLLTSSSFINSYFLDIDQYRFPFKVSKLSAFLSVSYFLSLVLLFLKNRKLLQEAQGESRRNVGMILVFLSILLLLLALSVRAFGAFKSFNLFFYQLPVFNTFRSPDKIFVLIPFVYLVVLIGMVELAKIKKIWIYLLFAVLLIIPQSFYTNGIVSQLSKPDDKGYRFVVDVPEEYQAVQPIINADQKSTAIILLPFSAVNSLDWSNYYKWHFVGADFLHLFYNKFYISANTYDHPLKETALSFKDYNEAGEVDPDKLLKLFENFSGEYVLWHKDVEQKWLDKSGTIKATLALLLSQKKLEQVEDNDYFTLYKLPPEKVKPLISASQGKVTFQKINPVRYRVSIDNIKDEASLIFHQSFNTEWKIYPTEFSVLQGSDHYQYSDGSIEKVRQANRLFIGDELSFLTRQAIAEDSHQISGTYANSWQIRKNMFDGQAEENTDGSYNIEFDIYFKPQSYYYLGVLSGLITLSTAVFALIYLSVKKRRDEEDI